MVFQQLKLNYNYLHAKEPKDTNSRARPNIKQTANPVTLSFIDNFGQHSSFSSYDSPLIFEINFITNYY